MKSQPILNSLFLAIEYELILALRRNGCFWARKWSH